MDLLLIFIGAGAIGASTSLILVRSYCESVFEAMFIGALLTVGVFSISTGLDVQHHKEAVVTNQVEEKENR